MSVLVTTAVNKNEPSRKVFESEIVIHVGMFVYMPIAAFTAFYSFYMLNQLSVIHHDLIEVLHEKASIGSTKETKKRTLKEIPTDIFQSFKEPNKATTDSSASVQT